MNTYITIKDLKYMRAFKIVVPELFSRILIKDFKLYFSSIL